MPKVVVELCDHPGCEKRGQQVYTEWDGTRRVTILCPEHRKPFDDIQKWGVPAPQPRRRGTERGTDKKRLDSLLIDE